MFSQYELDGVLQRMYLQAKRDASFDGTAPFGEDDPLAHWLASFSITEEEMMNLWDAPKEPALSFMKTIAAMQGLRDASEYFTLEGYLQLWCDGIKWDWFRDPDTFVFQFGGLAQQKEEMPDGRIHSCFSIGGPMVREVFRDRRPKERHIKPYPGRQQPRESEVQQVTTSDVNEYIRLAEEAREKEGSN
jgi:hypothetical protein